MKKYIFLLATMVFVMAAGSAFAGDTAKTGKGTEKPYNGITYFDLGAPSDERAPAEESANVTLYNGITRFDFAVAPRQSTAKEASRMPYNGITVFS